MIYINNDILYNERTFPGTRTDIHQQISSTSLTRVRRAVGLDNLAPSCRPVVYAMAGIPASGKSSFVSLARREGRFPDSAFVLNPDVVMAALDEYRHDLESKGPETAFSTWELPARELNYELLAEALDKGANIIKDMSCARPENYQMLEQFKDQGYEIRMFHIMVDPDVALQRLSSRESATGRHTPAELIHERARSLAALLPRYRTLVNEFHAYDNNDLTQAYRSIPSSPHSSLHSSPH